MGSGASTDAATTTKMDLTGKDVDTPRGVTAKAEVVRLRKLLLRQNQDASYMLAVARFRELDKDNSGHLENMELHDVVDWVMQAYGTKMGRNQQEVHDKLMARIDSNKDGKLDFEEFMVLFKEMLIQFSLLERAKVKFMELDADSSGFLESAEIEQVVAWAMEAFTGDDPTSYKRKLMNKIDANNDGKLDMDEFLILFEDMLVRINLLHHAREKFTELDADKSGFLEAAEIDALVEQVLQAYVEKSPADKAHFKATLISRIDKNRDGKLDIKEFADLWEEMLERLDLIEGARRKFVELDHDKSGFLERAELDPVVHQWAASVKGATGIDLEAALEEMMVRVDVNHDGKLNLMEFVAIFEEVLAKGGMWA